MKLDPFPRLSQDVPSMVRKLTDLFRDVSVQVNDLSEGRMAARYQARTAMPDSGTYAVGDFVPKSNPVEAGSASSKYVITGWIRLTAGDAHVAGTDWVEARVLTGN